MIFFFYFLNHSFCQLLYFREMIVLITTEHFPCTQEKVIFKTSDKSQSGIFYPTSTKVFTPSLAATWRVRRGSFSHPEETTHTLIFSPQTYVGKYIIPRFHPHSAHCGNYGNSLSRFFFGKNFVKATRILLSLEQFFRENNVLRVLKKPWTQVYFT